MEEEIIFIEDLLSSRHEIEDYTLSISSNKVSISLNLTDAIVRANS
jgi:uncharacterized protein with HEPN domain